MSRKYDYYDFQKAKVKIAMDLKNKGWEIFGFHEDQSDMMTDYWSPASWDGIATKNGFVLCVDIFNNSYSGKPITKYNISATLTQDERNKIAKLEQMTITNGCTEGEEANAQQLIQNIKDKKPNNSDPYEVIGYFPTFQNHPSKNCKWHIEKDGSIYDKGAGIGKFCEIPSSYEYDIEKMEYKEGYTHWRGYHNEEPIKKEISEELIKIINDYKKFIAKIEKIANIDILGDGTKETAAQAEKQTKPLEKVITQKTKKVIKPVEIERDYFKVGDIISLSYHGHYWVITADSMRRGTWTQKDGSKVTEERKAYSYECLGSEKKGFQRVKNTKSYYQWEKSMLRELQEGKIKIYQLKEVEEIEEVIKYVDTNKTTNKAQKPTKTHNTQPKEQSKDQPITQPKQTETATETEPTANKEKIKMTIETNEQFNGIEISFSTIPSKEIREILKSNGFRWHKAKKIWYAKNTGDRLAIVQALQPEQSTQNPIIEPATVETIQEQADNIIEMSTQIIIDLNLEPMQYLTDEEYKIKLLEYLKLKKYHITDELIDHIEYEELQNLLTELKDFISITEQQRQHEEQQEKIRAKAAETIEKINKNIESLEKKIEKLSGDHLVNTHKRMQEQASRDSKIASYEIDIKLLEHIKTKLIDQEPITALEENLTITAFRDEIHGYYNQKYGRYPRDPEFPKVNHQYDSNNWYNKEVPKKQARLKKANIHNNSELLQAVEEYKIIYDSVDRYISPNEQKIKELTNKFKMIQKGDIHFTDNKQLLETIIDLADITEGDRVLEPSAGIGSIADRLKEITDNVDVCEYNYSFCELLQLKNHNIVANDFLSYNSEQKYDRIVANVPFSDEQNHIKNIYNNLKDNGRAVIITSPHYTFASDRKSTDFRNWLDTLTYEILDVPQKSFTHTQVNCKILIVEKEEQTSQAAI